MYTSPKFNSFEHMAKLISAGLQSTFPLYEIPVAAETTDHKLSSFKQHRRIVFWPGVQKSIVGVTGP